MIVILIAPFLITQADFASAKYFHLALILEGDEWVIFGGWASRDVDDLYYY